MKQALYRNYRPRSFKELVGQEHVTTTLENALKAGRISHAYLFTGPRGVGKTSAARILAHVANELPYTDETTHLDIIEIDAASNRRIDEIRDLRDKVSVAPAAGKYKVYIIDEVHMLTREAFNALLKTLEEPPAHVIFILATTEAHKLPETIISRTQRFEFKPLPKSKMAEHLSKIAKSEKIEITPQALDLLAEFGAGSFRDSISYLDQLSAGSDKITDEDVRGILGLPAAATINQIIKQVANGDSAGLITSLEDLKDAGTDAAASAAAIAQQVRKYLIEDKARPALINLLKQLIDVPASNRPYDLLEVLLLEAASQSDAPKPAAVKQKSRAKSQAASIISPQIDRPAAVKSVDNLEFDETLWPKVVDASKQKAASLYTALKLAKPEFSENKLILRFEFPLHQKKLNLAANKALIANLIEEQTGKQLNIDCVVDKPAFQIVTATKAVPKKLVVTDTLHSISNIFGAAEVMET